MSTDTHMNSLSRTSLEKRCDKIRMLVVGTGRQRGDRTQMKMDAKFIEQWATEQYIKQIV
jgi:hypothetical protein